MPPVYNAITATVFHGIPDHYKIERTGVLLDCHQGQHHYIGVVMPVFLSSTAL